MNTTHAHALKSFVFTEHHDDDERKFNALQNTDDPYGSWLSYLVSYRQGAVWLASAHYLACAFPETYMRCFDEGGDHPSYEALCDASYEALCDASWWRAKAESVHTTNAFDAVGVWRYALHLEPNHAESFRGLGLSLYAAKYFALAIKPLRAACALVENADTWLKLGLCLKEIGGEEHVREGIEACIRGSEIDPIWWGYDFNSSLWSETYLNDLAAAEEFARQAYTRSQISRVAHRLIDVLIRREARSEALEVAERNAVMHSTNPSAQQRHARVLRVHSKWDDAIRANRKALDLKPSDDAYGYKRDLCISLYHSVNTQPIAQEKIAEMRSRVQEIAALCPDAQWLNNAANLSKNKLGDLKLAEILYRKGLESDGEDAHLLNNLGALLTRIGEVDEAQTLLERSVALHPNSSSAAHNLCNLFMETMRPIESEKAAFDYLSRGEKNCDDLLHILGHLYDDYGALEDAEAAWKAALLVNPTWSKMHHDLGMLYLKQHDLSKAEEAFQDCLNVDEESVYGMCGMIQLYTVLAEYSKARTWFERAHSLNPRHDLLMRLTVDVCLAEGNVEEALSWAHKAVQLNPYSGESYTCLGRALHTKGKLDGAIQSFRDAIRWNITMHAEPYNDLANVLREVGKYEEANAVDLKGAQFRSKKSAFVMQLKGFAEVPWAFQK